MFVNGVRLVRLKYDSKTEEGEIPTIYSVWTREDYWPTRERIFLLCNSSFYVAKWFHGDRSLEAVDRRAPNNSKNWQWMTESDISVRRSTLAPHGGEWPYSFLQEVGCTLVYFCNCTNVGFIKLSMSASPWTASKGVFIQDPPHDKPSTAVWCYIFHILINLKRYSFILN